MKINPAMVRRALELGQPLASIRERATGRTTSLILLGIVNALNKPGEWFEIRDHADGMTDTASGTLNMRKCVETKVQVLGLENMHIEALARSIRIKSTHVENL